MTPTVKYVITGGTDDPYGQYLNLKTDTIYICSGGPMTPTVTIIRIINVVGFYLVTTTPILAIR